MTVLGLKLSRRANAVSSLHGEVSRAMWTGLFPGQAEDDVPIGHITNGVHVPSWLAPQMFRLYDRHLGTNWHRQSGEPHIWEGIENIDDAELWETHQSLKARMLDFIRRRAIEQSRVPRRESMATLSRLGKVLSPDALTIGFARRFATYKRANLILADIERLGDMVNDPKRPVQFVFAGKAHPRDEPGKRVLQQIAQLMRDSQFAEHFVFVEDYDINVGRHLVQGVDVWLNNPRRPLEASGTSGQKVVLNGGLNLSVLDGWWAEAYDGMNGFAIGTGRTHSNMDVHDQRDGEDLYRVLQRRSDPALLPARPRRLAARLDQTDEADDPHARLALQRRPHGDGLHAEMLRPGGRRNFQRHDPQPLITYSVPCNSNPGPRITRRGPNLQHHRNVAPRRNPGRDQHIDLHEPGNNTDHSARVLHSRRQAAHRHPHFGNGLRRCRTAEPGAGDNCLPFAGCVQRNIAASLYRIRRRVQCSVRYIHGCGLPRATLVPCEKTGSRIGDRYGKPAETAP